MLSHREIVDNYLRVMDRIQRTAVSCGRNPDTVNLVVVTKTHPVRYIEAVVDAGASCLGENYADEAIPKIQELSNRSGIQWHMIGHVQNRKAILVAQNFSYLHSLDSLKLAKRLDHFAGDHEKKLSCLLEFNTSGEESKSGFPAWQEDEWEKLLPDIEQILSLSNLELRGLMTMAPYFEDGESSRPYFQRLSRLQGFLTQHFPRSHWSELSMGMSGDYQVAIEEGATWVRIGTSIFGPRQ